MPRYIKNKIVTGHKVNNNTRQCCIMKQANSFWTLEKNVVIKSIKKNFKLYVVWTIIYLPISIIIFMPQYPNILLNLSPLSIND